MVLDNAKIKRFVPGFAATIPFGEGIRRTLAWFEADPKRMVVNPATREKMDRFIRHYEERQSRGYSGPEGELGLPCANPPTEGGKGNAEA